MFSVGNFFVEIIRERNLSDEPRCDRNVFIVKIDAPDDFQSEIEC